jgi:hypothetical protein
LFLFAPNLGGYSNKFGGRKIVVEINMARRFEVLAKADTA